MSAFFRGISADQDGRFQKADEILRTKMAKAGKFAAILQTKVDLSKVNIDVIARWVTVKITEVLGFEDEIIISLIVNALRPKDTNDPQASYFIDPTKLQIDITGFLADKAKSFMEELWTLVNDAQQQASGIPSVFIQRKRDQILSRNSTTVSEIKDSDNTDENIDSKSKVQSQGIETNKEVNERPKSENKGDKDVERRRDDRNRSRDRRDRDGKVDRKYRERSLSKDRSRHSDRHRDSDRGRDRDRDRDRDSGRHERYDRERRRSRSRDRRRSRDRGHSRDRNRYLSRDDSRGRSDRPSRDKKSDRSISRDRDDIPRQRKRDSSSSSEREEVIREKEKVVLAPNSDVSPDNRSRQTDDAKEGKSKRHSGRYDADDESDDSSDHKKKKHKKRKEHKRRDRSKSE